MESLNESLIQPRDGFVDKIKSGVAEENKSRARIKLSEFEQQLHATEKKCKFVKKRLEYMKMVYQSVGPTGLETTVFDIPSLNSSESIVINSREIYHHDVSENIREVGNENFSLINDAKSPQHIAENNKNITSNYSMAKRKETKFEKTLHRINKTGKIFREGVSAIPIGSKHLSSSSDDNVSEPQEIFIMSPPTANGSKKSELIVKITEDCNPNSNSNKVRKVNKSAKVLTCASNAKLEQNELDNIGTGRVMKFRKRKTRMRRTNLKSVAASRPAIIIQERPFVKRNKRQENINSASDDVATINIFDEKKAADQTWNEVVEIYHNTAAINTSVSVVSSKQQFKFEELKNFEAKAPEFFMVDNSGTNQKIVHLTNDIEEKDGLYSRAETDQSICESPDDDDTCRSHKEGLKHHHGDCQQPTTMRSWCCESVAMRNYQQPTISSKLKQVKRCYFATRLNLQNIPFVVGTSVTRSHNLGLNMQQVFSLMKHRQLAMPSDIRPVLIRKVGEGVDPIIPFAEQLMMDDDGKENRAISTRQITQQDTQRIGHAGPSNSSNNHGDSAHMSAHITKSTMLRQREEELNIENGFEKYQSMTNNSSRIRNVLLKLHDQFEAMNDEYSKLQEEVQKTDDLHLREKLAELDSELTVKEEEISALMDVYREILTLKQQMKMYRGKNSVICITTQSNRKHSSRLGPSSISAHRSRIPHHHPQSLDLRKLRSTNSTREPVAATHLVGLLRQIQSFQQQLTAP